MSVKIRLSRGGKKRSPFYTIVAVDHRKHRDTGNVLERLGTYDPHTKEQKINKESIQNWLDKGAIPSETVGKLIKKEGLTFKEKVIVKKEKTKKEDKKTA